MKKILPSMLFILIVLAACRQSGPKLNNAGNEAFANQNYETALAAYQKAQVDSPDLPEPYYNAANTYYRREDYDQAQQHIQQALLNAQDPLAEDSYYNLGNTHYSAQDYEQAIEAYKDALRLNPGDEEAKHNLELALRALQQQQQQDQQQGDQQRKQPDQPDQTQQDQQQNDQRQDQPDRPQNEQQNQPDNRPQNDQPQNQGNQQPQDQPQTDQSQGQPQQVQGLTREQAQQLLAAAAQDEETLQEHLQQIAVSPGVLMEEDW